VNCRILGNVARVGGGVYCAGGSSAEFVNCAIAGNMAYRGGGIYCKYSAPRFVNCTVSRNTAVVRDGGISCVEATPTLINCILWRNAFESLCGTRLSCIADRDPLFVNPGVFDFTRYVSAEICGEWFEIPDYVVEDPDHHLKAGSPAIDSGTCEGAPDFDIEGSPRPTGLGCDIGAYEFAGVGEPLFVRGEANADGKLDIADMIYILSYEFTLGSRPLCLKAADITDDGIIDIGDPIAGLNYLFASGRVPPPPLSDCGVDPTADALTCDSYPACP